MDKNDTWDKLREPFLKGCLNCKYIDINYSTTGGYHTSSCSRKENLTFEERNECDIQEKGDTPKHWVWDGKSK